MPSTEPEKTRGRKRPAISIVIPTLNEAHRLPCLLRQLRTQAIEFEVILVDGGSSDDTVAQARTLNIRTIQSPPGRGRQLATGAAAATGDFLLFLHADSQLQDSALRRSGKEVYTTICHTS